MAASSRPRRVGGSRNPTGRPRRVAGGPAGPAGQAAPARPGGPEREDEQVSEEARVPEAAPAAAEEPVEEAVPARRPLAGRGVMRILLGVVAVVALVVVAEIVYLVRDPSPTVSAGRPVVTGELTHRAAVEAAARATEQILSTSYVDYDKQVDQAVRKMTPTFAREYRQTADGLATKYAEQRLKVQVKAVAQGVVQASPQQVRALLFLNQYIERQEKGGQPGTSFAQYRALVTVVRSDHGWLVSDIETK